MAKIQLKRGLSSNLTSVTLESGEPAYTTDKKKMYIGNPDGSKTCINPDITETMQEELDKKVDKVSGKGLSANDYDNTEKANVNTAYLHSQKVSGNPHGVTKADIGLGNVENKSSATIRGEITSLNITTGLGYTPLNSSLKGASNGLAELDSNGMVPASQLPSYVDDVLEGYLSNGKFYKESSYTTVITAEGGKIYTDLSTNKTYRWSGSAYVVISETITLGETSSTAFRGDQGKTAYEHSQKTSGNPHGVTKSDVGLGNVPNLATNDQTPTYTEAASNTALTSGEKLSVAFGKIAKAVSSLISHLANVSNPHSVTNAQVGLGNCDNTSDANKPISNATQAALNLKANITDVEAKGYLTANSIIDGGTF